RGWRVTGPRHARAARDARRAANGHDSPMSERIRFGVIGVGAVTLRGILPHLSEADVSERVRIEALCDPVVERADAAATQYGIRRTFVNVDEMLAEAELDAVT